MASTSRDDEIREVAARLDAILTALRANVDVITAILTRPSPGGGGDDERLGAL